jgi:tRNA nucleotidyltransferase (CCA-adding enzyme)
LLKQFLTVNGIYGADTKTQGFSGYVCELLIIHYKKFLDALKAVDSWKSGEVIDIKGFYIKKDFQKLRKEFKDQVLIVIDPTDKNRNTAAAVSAENLFILKKLAKEFLVRASATLFLKRTIEPITENDLVIKQMLRRTELILVKFKPPDVVPDILWPQLRKFSERLETIMKENEFVVLRKGEYTNEKDMAIVMLEMEVSKLPVVQKRIGPKVFDLDDSQRFLAKYAKQALAGPFIENNFWCVEIRRNFTAAREKLMDSLKENSEILKAKGIPNFIADQLSKSFEIISENGKIMELIKQDENFGVFLKKYFERESLI